MKLAIIDIETTGFVREYGESIVELAIVLCDTNTRKTEILFSNVLKDDNFGADKHRQAWIFKHSDLTYEDVEAAKNIEHYRDELQGIFSKYKITAYNKKFDTGWLNSLGFKYKDSKCLMETAKEYRSVILGETANPSVETSYQWLMKNGSYKEKHRALDDALDEAEILYKLCDIAENQVIREQVDALRQGKKVVTESTIKKVITPANVKPKTNGEFNNDPSSFEDKYDFTADEVDEDIKLRGGSIISITDEPAISTFSYKGKVYKIYYNAGRWGVFNKGQEPTKYYFCKNVEDLFGRFLNK